MKIKLISLATIVAVICAVVTSEFEPKTQVVEMRASFLPLPEPRGPSAEPDEKEEERIPNRMPRPLPKVSRSDIDSRVPPSVVHLEPQDIGDWAVPARTRTSSRGITLAVGSKESDILHWYYKMPKILEEIEAKTRKTLRKFDAKKTETLDKAEAIVSVSNAFAREAAIRTISTLPRDFGQQKSHNLARAAAEHAAANYLHFVFPSAGVLESQSYRVAKLQLERYYDQHFDQRHQDLTYLPISHAEDQQPFDFSAVQDKVNRYLKIRSEGKPRHDGGCCIT